MTLKDNMKRRDFLKGALAATAGAMVPLALSGCSSETVPTAAAATIKVGLSEEERAAATPDPSYMGGSTNFCGQKVVIGTDETGAIANQAMIDQHKNYKPHMVKVTERIYVSVGNALANSTMVIGDTGIIVIDTGECHETAELDLAQFRTVTDKPVAAVIYTHNHYTNGTTAFVPKGNPDNVPIIAQERFMQSLLAPFTEIAACSMDRAQIMFGCYLPWEGEDGNVGCGIGAYYQNPHVASTTGGLIPPNTLIPMNEHMTEMKIDGLTFQFFPTASDSADNINIYIVEEDTIVTNQAWGVFYNMFTLRGESYRDPAAMLKALDDLIALEAENLVSVHALPLIGQEKANEGLTLHRDCIQFVYDQTIRYMNKGYEPDEIAAAVKMPAYMVEGDITLPVYGEIEHYVRGVYRGLMGWFGTDPLELHPVSHAFESSYFVQLAGGADKMLEDARAALEDKQYAWAATLADYVLGAEPDNAEGKALKAQAFRNMAQVTQATNTRHWYMTSAWELEGKLDKSVAPSLLTEDKLAAAPRTLILDMLRVSLDPEKTIGMNESLVVTYIDEDTSNSMVIRNCIGHVVEGAVENPSAELKVPYPALVSVVLKQKTLTECIESGEATIEGSQEAFMTIMGALDMQL